MTHFSERRTHSLSWLILWNNCNLFDIICVFRPFREMKRHFWYFTTSKCICMLYMMQKFWVLIRSSYIFHMSGYQNKCHRHTITPSLIPHPHTLYDLHSALVIELFLTNPLEEKSYQNGQLPFKVNTGMLKGQLCTSFFHLCHFKHTFIRF